MTRRRTLGPRFQLLAERVRVDGLRGFAVVDLVEAVQNLSRPDYSARRSLDRVVNLGGDRLVQPLVRTRFVKVVQVGREGPS